MDARPRATSISADDGPVCEEGSDECAAACTAPRTVGQFELCVDTTDASYTVTARYLGQGQLALEASEITLNGKPFDATEKFDKDTKTFTIHATGVEPSKYSFLFRLKTDAGDDLRPLFVPMWIGSGTRYADFTWHDSIDVPDRHGPVSRRRPEQQPRQLHR